MARCVGPGAAERKRISLRPGFGGARQRDPFLLLPLAACALVTSLAWPVAAKNTDDATRGAARSLGYEGIHDFQAGKFEAATNKLDRAYRALRVPSLGLWSARALAKSGKLVAAAERYLEVQRLDTQGGDVAVQAQAQADARTEHAALEPRVPGVVIHVEGAPGDEVTLTVNGISVPSSLLDAKRPVDPGTVTIEAVYAGRTLTEKRSLKEGETTSVTLRFSAGAATELEEPSPTPMTPLPRERDAAPSSGAWRTVGFVALGLGGAGLVVGGVTGGLAMSTRGSIEGCIDTRCPPSKQDDVDSYNRLRMVSSASFIGGAVLATAGLVLVLSAPKAKSTESTASRSSLSLSPWVGAGLTGLSLEARR